LVCGTKQNNRDLIMKFIGAKKKETQMHYAFRILYANDSKEYERY
jgi:ribosomal protein L27